MTVPGWWELLLLALAAYRVWRLAALDDLLEPWRARLPKGLDAFLGCPQCAGFWITLGWWGAWEAWPHWALVAAAPWAVHAVMVLVATRLAGE